jgi:hypothetical protein
MKKLFLLTLTLFLFGCDLIEQDTRLICDCMYAYYDREKADCLDNSNNKSLVFNELANKFLFDGVLKGQMEFEKDEIKYESGSFLDLWYSFKLDRTNLVYSEMSVNNELETENSTYYQCRLTDGV